MNQLLIINWQSLITRVMRFRAIAMLLLLFALQLHSLAQLRDPEQVSYMSGNTYGAYQPGSHTLAVDSVVTTESLSSVWPTGRIQNLVQLRVLEETTDYLASPFSARILVNIRYGDNSSATNTLRRDLEVDYKPGAGEKYDATQYVSFEGAAFVEVKIVEIDIAGISQADAVKQLVVLNSISVTRSLQLNSSATPSELSHMLVLADELQVSVDWAESAGNNATQLEWAWLEDEMEDNYMDGETLVLSRLFANNATRIEIPLDQTSYNIPLYYDGVGKLYYRVRPVLSTDFDTREGVWTYGAAPYSFNGHESGLNWQVTTSFAEEGKRKTVMQYFDGSLRNRQTVTKDNLNRTSIIAETLYDEQGRPAVQVLPAPGMQNVIRYTRNLNLFNGQASDSDPLAFFDLEPVSPGIFPVAMSKDTGAAKYYSDQNPELYSDSRVQHLPDAEGFTYTLTRYTPDATGRIMSQSGVGKTFRMGGGHETKYFYGSPSQEELDGLFGTEVGYASHYFKNMVQDANGQMSVSYVDMHGRTIATALAGAAPANLDSLDINNKAIYPNQAGENISRNLLTPGINVVKDNRIEAVSSLLVPAPTAYQFRYQLDTASLQLPTCTSGVRCYDLQYDLEFSIVNESGDSLPIIRRFTNVSLEPDDDCATPVGSFRNEEGVVQTGNVIEFTQILGPGAYLLRKTLTLNETSLAHYKEIYLQKALCVTEQDIIDSLYSVFVTQSGCDTVSSIVPCEQCLVDLGDSTSFRSQYLANMGDNFTDSLALEQEIRLAYAEAQAYCRQVCDGESPILALKRDLMLSDMTPYSGQYAVGEAPGGGMPLTLFNQFNIFATGGSGRPFYQNPVKEDGSTGFYVDALGSIDLVAHPLGAGDLNVHLQTLTPDAFNEAFSTRWAQSLIAYHPEFGKLKFAEDSLANIYHWIYRYDKIDNWDQASDSSRLYTNAASINDPFYSIAPARYKDTMAAWIGNSYLQGLSLWQLAYGDVKCKTIVNLDTRNSCYYSAPKTPLFTGLTAEEEDLVWLSFQALYTAARNQQVDAYIDERRPVAENDNLVANEYVLRFPKSVAQLAAQAGWTGYSTDPYVAPDTTGMGITSNPDSVYAGQCSSYVPQWTQALLQCDSLRSHPDSDTIIAQIVTGMLEVCAKGSDELNPLGASEVAPGTPVDGSPRNFEQVILAVFAAYNIPPSTWCNPYVIENPGPYGKSRPLYDQYVTSLDSCHCERFDSLKAEAQTAGYSPYSLSTLNQYLLQQYQDTLSNTLYTALQQCGDLGTWYLRCDTIGYDSTYYHCDSIPPGCPGAPMTLMAIPEDCPPGYVWSTKFNTCVPELVPEPDSCWVYCPILDCDTLWSTVIPLVLPEKLPDFLQCGYVNIQTCFSCVELSILTQAFKDTFNVAENPGLWYPYNTGPLFLNTELDEAGLAHNQAFARFLNYRTGLKLTWNNYALLADSSHCNLAQYIANQGGQPDTLLVPSRSGNKPGEYVATQWIQLTNGFDSDAGDNFLAYISTVDTALTDIVVCINPAPVNDTTGFTTFDPPCEKAMTMAVALGQEIYRIRTQKLLGQFEQEYRAFFAAAGEREEFTVAYRNSEYHYTLYYYDQAGNLVKTVPPKGVNPDFSEAFLNDVATARASNTVETRPHSLVTEYRYNSLNQVVEQKSPDAGVSRFWYDRLGRLVVSQNAQQAIDDHYSYTRYDALGRIIEVGQKPHTTSMTQELSRNDAALNNWITVTGSTREQVTLTGYDQPWGYELYPAGILADSGLLSQRHLRNRVSWTMVKETEDASDHIGSFYTYDIHGNVDTLLQDFKALWAMRETGNRFKRITYQYDLISGKVNGINYQPGRSDSWYHRYEYDAENRLVLVKTSRDSIYWEEDAEYSYYKHGPLARTRLGKLNVHGLDYAYTLQGWLKGVNSTAVDDGLHDMGRDGYTGLGGDISKARDIFGFALHYYDDGSTEEDYVPVGGLSAFARPNNGAFRSLYNGNIAGMSVNNAGLSRASSGVNALPLFYRYEYDQLNRILRMRTYKGMNNSSNAWTPVAINDYKEDVVYDANGNILSYDRNGAPELSQPQGMDSLDYEYYTNTNRLKRVVDSINSANYAEDIDNQADAENYVYDAIGNLIEDKAEDISAIHWNVYGKISSIVKPAGTITYLYDAAGNRIAKMFNGDTTLYVRDASGNTLSVYTKQSTGPIEQAEVHLFGSARLGMTTLRTANDSLDIALDGDYGYAKELTFTRGEKIFELSNHLGNVLVTISDRRLATDDGNGEIAWYEADVVTANDYYPFGMGMPGRKFTTSTGAYRYGFNGQEKSAEIDTNGNSMTAEFWQYDARLGRRWNVDPVIKSYESPYLTFGGNPVWIIDPSGADTLPVFRGNSTELKSDLKKKDIGAWLDLLNFTPSKQLVKEMTQRRGLARASVQEIGRAANDPTNFDYYSLKISKLPFGESNFRPLFELFRVTFRHFFTGSSSFKGFNPDENKKWESSNPLGSVMSFDEDIAFWQVVGDDASVLTSENYSDENGAYWNFSTLNTPWADWGHPVSGTRQFGIAVNTDANGAKTYTFFIRGVDRVSDEYTKLGGFISSEYIFSRAHKTWTQLMNNVNQFINANGGLSEINEAVSQRLDWKDVKGKYTVPTPCYICQKDHNK